MKLQINQLPKSVQKALKNKADNDGFIHGYFLVSENHKTQSFMNESDVLFECSKPTIITMTHSIIRFHLTVLTGYSESGNRMGEIIELTVFY